MPEPKEGNFIDAFRAAKRPFIAGAEPCVECGEPSDTYCESCESALCYDHADITQYEDVDVCASEESCNQRLEVLELAKKGAQA